MSNSKVSNPGEPPYMTGPIASEQLLLTRPDLHHYTNLTGLAGILATQTLWATHFRDVNDATEVVHLRPLLAHALSERFRTTLQEKQAESFRVKRAIQRSGGLVKAATDLAESWVTSLYQTTFEDNYEFRFGEPCIVSFCSHATEPYERENGLLSQWRGYSGTDGVCAIFDTKGMSELLQREFATHLYTHIELAEVEYATDDFEAGAFCGDLINLSDDFIVEMIDGGSPAMSGVAFEAFISCATLLKHQGFKEEREVRIVAIPGTYSLRQRLLAIHPGVPLPPINQIRTRIGRHGQSRYVRLFESLNEKLPLKRVIVGPSRNQEENTRKVLELLGSEAAVTCSATPFLG